MSTIRFFSGAREPGKHSIAGSLVRFEFQKKGKMTAAARHSYIFKKRMEAKREDANKKLQSIGGTYGTMRQMSKRAEKALKEVAARKAAKQAKIERKMVIIQPRTFPNGMLKRDGKLFDVAGNIVAKIDSKTGKMATMNGWSLGRYKPKSFLTDRALQEAIDKYSPHFINLRKQQALAAASQQGFGVHGPAGDVIVHTPPSSESTTSWGSGGTNIWGGSSTNVWGTSGGLWGGGMDYLGDLAERVAAFFGLK